MATGGERNRLYKIQGRTKKPRTQKIGDPKQSRKETKKKKQLLSKATVGRGNPEARKSRSEEGLARTRRIFIRDRWDCLAHKRKVIDAQSMIGEPRLCSVGSSSGSSSSSWFLLLLPSTTHPQRGESRAGWVGRRGRREGKRSEERRVGKECRN